MPISYVWVPTAMPLERLSQQPAIAAGGAMLSTLKLKSETVPISGWSSALFTATRGTHHVSPGMFSLSLSLPPPTPSLSLPLSRCCAALPAAAALPAPERVRTGRLGAGQHHW